ncbi:MAG: TIGR00725 family protein [Rhodospirillaceae bacterium]
MYALDPATNRLVPAEGGPLDAMAALRWLQTESGAPLRAPIGVIGPREDDTEREAAAEAVGRLLAEAGFTVLCGGRGGVMRAASKGAAEAGGLTIGLLPGDNAADANPYVAVPIASGIGEARNAIIACAAAVLVVIGDSYGTLSEVALGLRFGKTVFGLCHPPQVEGVRALPDVAALAPALARHLLG